MTLGLKGLGGKGEGSGGRFHCFHLPIDDQMMHEIFDGCRSASIRCSSSWFSKYESYYYCNLWWCTLPPRKNFFSSVVKNYSLFTVALRHTWSQRSKIPFFRDEGMTGTDGRSLAGPTQHARDERKVVRIRSAIRKGLLEAPPMQKTPSIIKISGCSVVAVLPQGSVPQ